MPMARGRKLPSAMGAPSSRSSGSPPGSSSTSVLLPRSRSNASGRTAHGPSSASFKLYSWARRLRQLRLGWSDAGTTASTGLSLPSSASRQVLQKTRSLSAHKTLRRLSGSASRREDRFNCRTPPVSWFAIWLCASARARNGHIPLEPAVCHGHGAVTMPVPGTQAPFGRTILTTALHLWRPAEPCGWTFALDEQRQSAERQAWGHPGHHGSGLAWPKSAGQLSVVKHWRRTFTSA
jgi:hypothetical protein